MKRLLSWALVLALVLTSVIALVACKPTIPTKTVDKIEVADTALSCYVGDTFDTSKIKITITYSDETTETKTVAEAKATATAVDTSSAGSKEVTITLDGKTVNTTVLVRVKSEGGDPDDVFNYYSTSKLPADKKIYVLNDTDHGYKFLSLINGSEPTRRGLRSYAF